MPVHLEIPTGLPNEYSASEEEAWSSLVDNQLTNTRKTAESWRTGLVALMGLIAGFSLIKGPSDIGGLAPLAAIAVGVLLLFSFTCATIGSIASLAAAYGKPSVISRKAIEEGGGIEGFKLEQAQKSVSNLKLSQILTIATLALVAIALGVAWYAPRKVSVVLNLEQESQPSVCGKLVSSQDGYVDLSQTGGEKVRVKMTDVTKLSAVEKCS